MAIPPTAVSFSDALDPQEELDFEIPCSPILETDETIASYTLTLLPEAVALGLEIMSGSGRDQALTSGNTGIAFWLQIVDEYEDDAAFEDTGTSLPLELTIVTNSSPPRTRQRTFLVRVAQQ